MKLIPWPDKVLWGTSSSQNWDNVRHVFSVVFVTICSENADVIERKTPGVTRDVIRYYGHFSPIHHTYNSQSQAARKKSISGETDAAMDQLILLLLPCHDPGCLFSKQ